MRLVMTLLAVGLLAAPAAAEIYRWTDAQGRMHFAQSLNQVPPQYRKQAEDGAKAKPEAGPSRVQTYSGADSAGRFPAARAKSPSGSPGEVHRIRVSRAGTSMLVNVRLNESVTAPFIRVKFAPSSAWTPP